MRKILLILVLFCSTISCGTDKKEQILTNQSIIDLTKAGMSDNLICQFISSNATQFKVAEMKDITYLKQNNVSERVIMEMIKTQEKEDYKSSVISIIVVIITVFIVIISLTILEV
ncbi:hypothetical protein PG593_03730 [Riemerella anatipestifer]|nr:hypothetical protein [Riemerella anatipestifer]MDY3538262.1 hypothetical protein [Riemerella anatipestifer]